MTIKRPILKSFIAITFAALVITGCKKEEEPEPTPAPVATDGTTEQSQRASDQSNSDNESNTAMDEANTAMQDVSTTRDFQACGMIIDSSQKAIGKITLNYNGNDCSGTRSRSGSIIIKLPYDSTTSTITRWSDPGCKAELTFVNYKVTYLANNKSLKFNGTHSITNVYGGYFLQRLLASQPIVYKVRADMQISYDDGTSRIWKAAKSRTYSQVAGVVKTTVEGDTIVNGHNDVAAWGTTRMGDSFTLDVPTPIAYYIYGSTCLYKPTGMVVLYVATKSLSITYGVDIAGTIVTGGCPYGYKLNWTDIQGTPQQYVVAY
ncbi:MAG: hypothetical protein V4608_10215 [Bacteroidota bacterium]